MKVQLRLSIIGKRSFTSRLLGSKRKSKKCAGTLCDLVLTRLFPPTLIFETLEEMVKKYITNYVHFAFKVFSNQLSSKKCENKRNISFDTHTFQV